MQITIPGAGHVGSPIARDLADAGCYEKLLEGYAERNVNVREIITELD